MFDEIFMKFDRVALETFIDKVRTAHRLKSKTKDMADLLIDALKEEVKKPDNSNVFVLGMADETLTNAIIKADTYMELYLKNKEKKKKENPGGSIPKNITIGNNYYDKNGQKHKKAEPKVRKTAEKKETIEEFEEFDFAQLDLFDL